MGARGDDAGATLRGVWSEDMWAASTGGGRGSSRGAAQRRREVGRAALAQMARLQLVAGDMLAGGKGG